MNIMHELNLINLLLFKSYKVNVKLIKLIKITMKILLIL